MFSANHFLGQKIVITGYGFSTDFQNGCVSTTRKYLRSNMQKLTYANSFPKLAVCAEPVKFSWAAKRPMPQWHRCASASTFLVCVAIVSQFLISELVFLFVAVLPSSSIYLLLKNNSDLLLCIAGGGCTIDCTTEDRIVCITPGR